MRASSLLLFAGTLIFAIGAALLARALLAPAPTPPPVTQEETHTEPAQITPTQAVLVASRPLAPGEFIDGSAVQWQRREGDYSPLLYFVSGHDQREDLFGATLREAVAVGEPLTNRLLVRPNEPGFIAAVLKPGMRAISVPTDMVASNAGLVAPGDRVDVILRLNRRDDGNDDHRAPQLASQTLLGNVRLLALNSRTGAGLAPRRDDTLASATGGEERSYFETATLEVTPRQAEQLAVASQAGTLQLAIRAAGEPQSSDPLATSVMTLTDATHIYQRFGTLPPAPTPQRRIELYRGNARETLTTGRN